jgi:hypothetical protein
MYKFIVEKKNTNEWCNTRMNSLHLFFLNFFQLFQIHLSIYLFLLFLFSLLNQWLKKINLSSYHLRESSLAVTLSYFVHYRIKFQTSYTRGNDYLIYTSTILFLTDYISTIYNCQFQKTFIAYSIIYIKLKY